MNQAVKNELLTIIDMSSYVDEDTSELATVNTMRELYLLSVIAKVKSSMAQENGASWAFDKWAKRAEELSDTIRPEFVASNHDVNPKTKTQLIRAWATPELVDDLKAKQYAGKHLGFATPSEESTENIESSLVFASIIPEYNTDEKVFAFAIFYGGNVIDQLVWIDRNLITDWNPEQPDWITELLSSATFFN